MLYYLQLSNERGIEGSAEYFVRPKNGAELHSLQRAGVSTESDGLLELDEKKLLRI